MSFLSFFKKKSKEGEVQVALDIGTEYVKAVLFTVDSIEKKIFVKGYGRCRQHTNAMQGAMIINIENVTNACDMAIGSAIAYAEKHNPSKDKNSRLMIPRKCIIGIAGELVRGVTIMADYERENPKVKIIQKELDDVIKHIKEEAFNDALIDIAEEIGVKPESLEEINTKINATYIDGVKVDDPTNFTGKNITYRVFSTFAPSLHINSLKQVAKNLNLQLINIEVEPYAVARAIAGGRKEDFNAIILDLGGGTTDIAIIEKGVVAGTKMFAFGGRVITKRIAHDFGIDLNAAEDLKINYSNGKAQKVESDKIKSILVKDFQVWGDGVELGLKEIEDVESYPSVIYLCGGSSALPEVKTALMEHPWLQVLHFSKFPRVEFLYPKNLDEIEDLTRSIIDPMDVTPLSLARMVLENNK